MTTHRSTPLMRRVLNAVLVLTVATTLSVAVAAQGGGGQGGGRGGGRGFNLPPLLVENDRVHERRGGARGFNLPPLLMETDAFPDGGIVPPKYVSANNGASVLPAFKISNAPA